MEEKEIKVEDESGDKKYFTIVPNIILNHSTANAQALYLQLKRLAGEKGIACCGSRYLQKQLKMTHNTIRKEFTYLLDKNWIKYVGEENIMTGGGMQKMKSYKIVDLWSINIKEYQNNNTLVGKGYQNNNRGVSKEQRRGIKITTKEEPNNIKNIVASDTPFSLEEKLSDMEKVPNSINDIIATFIREKEVRVENSKQLSAVIARYVKVAKQLSGAYSNEQIFKATKEIKEENIKRDKKGDSVDWTLETILKKLTK